jgi:hypothetical protein
MATHKPAPINLRDEHIASRREWGRYVELTTALHRRVGAQADEFLAQVWAQIERAKLRS